MITVLYTEGLSCINIRLLLLLIIDLFFVPRLLQPMARLLSERGPGVTCWEFLTDRRFSSPMSSNVGLDETDDRILVKMLWKTRVYVLQNFKDFTELGKKLTS